MTTTDVDANTALALTPISDKPCVYVDNYLAGLVTEGYELRADNWRDGGFMADWRRDVHKAHGSLVWLMAQANNPRQYGPRERVISDMIHDLTIGASHVMYAAALGQYKPGPALLEWCYKVTHFAAHHPLGNEMRYPLHDRCGITYS